MPIMVRRAQAASVEVQPEAVLRGYRVFAAEDGHHFAGLNEVTGRGRVSSAIASFDPDAMTGVTSSGRAYRLDGPPDDSGVAEILWRAWAAGCGLGDYTDVTAEYSPAARPGLN